MAAEVDGFNPGVYVSTDWSEEANGGVVFHQRTKAVMATYHIATDNVKAKITNVRENVANNIRKDDIAVVLDYFEQDTTKTIEAFNTGKTDSILETWFVSGKKGGKGTQPGKNKKRRNRQGNQNVNNAENDATKTDSIQHPSTKQPAGSNSTDLSTKEIIPSAKDTAVRLPQPIDNNNKTSQPNLNLNNPTERGKSVWNQRRDQSPRQGPQSSRQGERQGDGRNRRTQGRNRVEQQKGPNAQNNSRRRDGGRGTEGPNGEGPSGEGRIDKEEEDQEGGNVRERTTSESSTKGGKKKPGVNFERLEKDLHRTTVSLTRCKNNLTTQLEDSEKRLKKAFQEVRQQLQERELALLNDFNDIKRQSETLIDTRQQTASGLRMKIAKANSLPEQEIQELRASLKHFVSERKTDEEISQTMRFTYTPDQLIAEVKKYGDVNMDISRYSSRRLSVDSLSTISRTTSVCEDNPQTLSRGVSLSESVKSPDSTGPKSKSDIDLSVEATNFATKIQQKFQARSRGGQARRGPRNQSGGRGRQDGGGRRRENSGSQDQNRRPQNNQDGARRRQNSGGQEVNRKRTNSGSAEKNNNDRQKEGNRENQRPPRREVSRGDVRGQQEREPKTGGTGGEKTEQPESKVVVEGGGNDQQESPKKQRNFNRRQQHRKRQGSDGHQGNDVNQSGSPKRDEGKDSGNQDGSTKKDEVKAGENPGIPKPQENGPKITKNEPKSSEKTIAFVRNGPTVLNGEAKMTPPSIEIDASGDSESGASLGSTPVSSPGANCGSSERAGPADNKEGIPNGPLTNGKVSDDDNTGDKGYHKESNDSTDAKKIIEREKVESTAGKESAMMVNGDTKVDGELAGKDDEDHGEK